MYLARYYVEKEKWIPAINRFKIVVENYNNSREEEFKREASLSKEKQKKMESQKSPPFEEYLAEFLNKVS